MGREKCENKENNTDQLYTPERIVLLSPKMAFQPSKQKHGVIHQLHMLPDRLVHCEKKGSDHALAPQVELKMKKGSEHGSEQEARNFSAGDRLIHIGSLPDGMTCTSIFMGTQKK